MKMGYKDSNEIWCFQPMSQASLYMSMARLVELQRVVHIQKEEINEKGHANSNGSMCFGCLER